MNWKLFRPVPWIDTRARFVSSLPRGGALLDLGSSTGETLNHIAELRPDLRFHAVDIEQPANAYPPGCQFARADLEKDRLPFADSTFDGITCMQLVEHLRDIRNVIRESARILKPGSRLFIETPHPKTASLSSPKGRLAGTFCLNFYDHPGHTRPASVGFMAEQMREFGLQPIKTGLSRNWLFFGAYPFFALLPNSRHKLVSYVHWIGWSAYIIGEKQ